MATLSESNDEEEDAERKVLEKEISELRSAKKELFEQSRPINEKLERIAHRERECVNKLHRLATDNHDREKQQQTIQRLVELEAELKHLKTENQTLKRELSEVHSERRPENVDSGPTVNLGELQKQLHETRKLLNKTREELSGTRQRLSDVQERLTVAEQVTAATQQRELQESGNSEQLQLELTPQHHSTTCTGAVVIISESFK